MLKITINNPNFPAEDFVPVILPDARIVGEPSESLTTARGYTRLIVLNPELPTSLGAGKWFHVPVGGSLSIEAI